VDNFKDIDLSGMKAVAEDPNVSRMYKSQLYQLAKCAKGLFELIEDGDEIEDWARQGILSSYKQIEEIFKHIEYEKAHPRVVEDPLPEVSEEEQKENNNFLSNEDKRFPTPMEGESGDQFIGRCILDPNMKGRYVEQSDRFMACMIVWNQVQPEEDGANNPGEKFEDPMVVEEVELNPSKPILP
jgi:hypothetical protein